METTEIEVTSATTLVTDVTDDLLAFCRDRGDGLASVFVPHATAGVALMETGSGSEPDLADAVERIVPRDGRYVHRHGSPGHGGDHVLPVFVAPSLTVPVVEGRPTLGTWQRLVLIDPNVDNRTRRVRFSFLRSA